MRLFAPKGPQHASPVTGHPTFVALKGHNMSGARPESNVGDNNHNTPTPGCENRGCGNCGPPEMQPESNSPINRARSVRRIPPRAS